MRAGTGVTHSEYNASKTEPVHFLQIWIMPDTRGLAPALRPEDLRRGGRASAASCSLASKDGRDGSIQVHQDADRCWVARLGDGRRARARARSAAGTRGSTWRAASGRSGGLDLAEGDGAAMSDEAQPCASLGRGDAEVLLFDLA